MSNEEVQVVNTALITLRKWRSTLAEGGSIPAATLSVSTIDVLVSILSSGKDSALELDRPVGAAAFDLAKKINSGSI